MSPLLSFATISLRSSTHLAYCRSPNASPATGAMVTAHAPSFAGLSFTMKWNLVPAREREELPVVVARLDLAVVDRDQIVALLDLQVVVIGRPVLVDVGDLVEAGRIRREIESGMPRLERRPVVVDGHRR